MVTLYIHVPFCRRRCTYCDFYFVISHRHVEDYVQAVCREIELRSMATDYLEPVRTVYFGGGTPSRLSTDQLNAIMQTVSRCYDTTGVEEVTIEVNPEDPDTAYLDRLCDLGFTRLSVGLQSLDDDDLSFMNRSHSAGQAKSFIGRALKTGFRSVSVDLIFGLPAMTRSGWKENLDFAVSCGAHHVSLYGLTIEPETVLGNWVRTGKVTPAPDHELEAQFRLADEVMTAHDFEHYEISNFARSGHRSRHNQSYWNHGDYLGFGPAAHSFGRFPTPTRWENVRSLRHYIDQLGRDQLPVAVEEELDAERLMQEYVLLGLRTDGGISLTALRDEYGHSLTAAGEEIVGELQLAGKLRRVDDRIVLSLDGYLVADSITAAFLTGEAIAAI